MSFSVDNSILIKNWRLFTIMHKDRRVAAIREDGTCRIYNKAFMPYNLYLCEDDDIDNRINNLTNFYYWCSSRVLTLDRKYSKEILNSIGSKQAVTDKDRAMIAISYRALSLTDVYWVRANRSSVSFKDINLYNNSLSNVFVDVSLCGKNITLQNSKLLTANDVAGDVSVQGVSPKAWIREDDKIYLLKNGDRRDVDAEILASKIASCFKVDSVKYDISYFDNKAVSKSAIITSQDKSIIPIEHIDIHCANKELDRNEFVIKKDEYSYHMMNLIDYLIGNTDRHWGNWGFFVDNDTNRLEKLHPLMDFNKSFQAYDTLEGTKCLTNNKNESQLEAAICAVKTVGLNRISNINPEWFGNEEWEKMFFERLGALEKIN